MTLASGVYFSCISLGVFSENICVPYKPDCVNISFTGEYFGEQFDFDKEKMIVTRLKNNDKKPITEWTSCGIQFIPFKL